jgi:hypothetical protein
MVIALNVAHYRICLQVRGQQLAKYGHLTKTHIIVIAVALIHAIQVTVSFGPRVNNKFGLIKFNSDQNKVTVFFAVWFLLLNECTGTLPNY